MRRCFSGAFVWVGLDDGDGKELLIMIVKLYITVRGLSFASSCVERYKKQSEKCYKKVTESELFTSTLTEYCVTVNGLNIICKMFGK